MNSEHKSIYLTGSTGFVGRNLEQQFKNSYNIIKYSRGDKIYINSEVVIHLAGVAHDLKCNITEKEYYIVNTDLTKLVFDEFLKSDAKIFIFLSSIKAVADFSHDEVINEEVIPSPVSVYGKSKLMAEKYIQSKNIPLGKKFFILRPCMIHGKGNKGNLNLLYKLVKSRLPWPLGKFENKRSYCSIDNLLFVINELMNNSNIPSGIYNICDDIPISTNELIKLISSSIPINTKILKLPKVFILNICKIGDFFSLPFNSEKLDKLTQNFVIDNSRITKSIEKKMPLTSIEGLKETFNSFNINN